MNNDPAMDAAVEAAWRSYGTDMLPLSIDAVIRDAVEAARPIIAAEAGAARTEPGEGEWTSERDNDHPWPASSAVRTEPEQ